MFAFRIVLLFVAMSFLCGADDGPATLEITSDTTLDPQKTYGSIVIKKSGVTVDGRGSVAHRRQRGESQGV